MKIITCSEEDCGMGIQVDEVNTNPNMPIKCPYCGNIMRGREGESPSPVVPKPITPVEPAVIEMKKGIEDALGWIIIHDENYKRRAFDLKEGENIIGRSVDANIVLDHGDKYVSRLHCIIKVSKISHDKINYILYDYGYKEKGKASTNGTYLSENENRLKNSDCPSLKNGDTIQIGRTKVVLQTVQAAKNKDLAIKTVIQQPYARTIIKDDVFDSRF